MGALTRFVCLTAGVFVAPAAAQTVELSGTFTPPIVGDVEFLLFPGNGRVVYYAGPNSGQREYHSVPFDGSAPPVVLTQFAGRSMDFSADGSRAVYYGGFGSLLTVLTDGSAAPVAIDTFPIEDANNYHPRISPDGRWVVYYQNEVVPLDLRSARSDGSGVPNVLITAFVPTFTIGPDSTRVFFTRATGLMMVPLDGSASALSLSGPPVAGGGVSEFVVSPDGTRAVYAGDVETDGFVELFGVPSDGSASPVELSAGGEVVLDSADPPSIPPSGNVVVFRMDRENDGNIELCRAPLDGSAPPVELSGSLGPNRDVTRHRVAPDGKRVLFLADRDVDEQFELHLASVTGAGQPVQISAPVAGDVREFAVSADSRFAVYRADQAQVGLFELFSVPIGKLRRGGAPRVTRLNPALPAGAVLLSDFQVVGRRVVYTLGFAGGRFESFSVPIEGGAVLPLTPDFGPDGYAGQVTASPEGVGVFLGSPGAQLGERVFGEPLDESSSPLDLSGPLAYGSPGQVESFLLTPDGRHALYVAGEDVPGMLELHHVPTNGAIPAVEISGAFPFPEFNATGVTDLRLSADGTRVAYSARQMGDALVALYEGPADGSVPAEKRSGAEGDAMIGFTFSADGARLIYRSAPTPSTQGLYSVRADGALPPTRLNVAGGGNQILGFTPSPDGSRTVYLSDELVAGKRELFSVPTDASAPRMRLHGTVADTSDVNLFAIDPSGQRVARLISCRSRWRTVASGRTDG